jgi:hypothetical protein
MICDSSNHVKPDPSKGTVVITDGDFIGTKKLIWIRDDTAQEEESAFLIPNVSKFSKVTASNDRVYILKNTETKLFFYMQEPDQSKDQEIMQKVNQIINEGPEPMEGLQEAPQHNHPAIPQPLNPHPSNARPTNPQGALSQQQLTQLLSNPELLQRLMGSMRQQIPECNNMISSRS